MIVMEGGKNKVYDIEHGDELPAALFFTDKGVKDILTPFYEKEPNHTVKKVDVEKEWGKKITTKVFGSADEKPITASLINDLWTTEDDDGLLRAAVDKKPLCPLE
jgi:hypothetical protein